MDPAYLVIIIVLLLLSGFFSASETAIISLSPAKVRTLVDEKARGSFYLKKLKENPHSTLITILVGNNLVNIAASAVATVMTIQMFGSTAVGVATGILTLLVLVFGEVLPKSVATVRAKSIALTVAAPLYFLGLVLTPVIWALDLLVGLLLKATGHKKTQKSVTDEELIAMATIGAEEGAIDVHEKEFIENVLEFTDIKVDEVMTPRVHIDAMPEDYTLKEASDFVINHTHTRIPIYRDTIDHIVGIISLKSLLKNLHEGEKDRTMRQVKLQTPLRVTHTMQVHDLFLLFKKHRQHIAIVIDEYGGTAGLVTLEDLLEEIVGDIEDETDVEEEWVKKLSDVEYELSGRIQLEELEEITGLEFNLPWHKTIGYLLAQKMGHLPDEGDTIKIDSWEFEVTQKWRNTIMKVRARKVKKKT